MYLATPLDFEANTRCFVSIIGRTPIFSASWGWAQGEGPGTTFDWMRGAHMYFNLGDGRAFVLSGSFNDSCASADYNGDGTPDVLDFLNFLDDFGNCDRLPARCGTRNPNQYNPDGVVDIIDFLASFDIFGQCA